MSISRWCYGIALFNVLMAIINLITGASLVLVIVPVIVALALASLTLYADGL